jgi:hypothetical protein
MDGAPAIGPTVKPPTLRPFDFAAEPGVHPGPKSGAPRLTYKMPLNRSFCYRYDDNVPLFHSR